jgi:hypothetical protein
LISANIHPLHRIAVYEENEAFKLLLVIAVALVAAVAIKMTFYGASCASNVKLKGRFYSCH